MKSVREMIKGVLGYKVEAKSGCGCGGIAPKPGIATPQPVAASQGGWIGYDQAATRRRAMAQDDTELVRIAKEHDK